jgi:hypothetical protein
MQSGGRRARFQGSITSAQASVGAAATWPTTGTIFKPAEATRQGAATAPHPDTIAQIMSRANILMAIPASLNEIPRIDDNVGRTGTLPQMPRRPPVQRIPTRVAAAEAMP